MVKVIEWLERDGVNGHGLDSTSGTWLQVEEVWKEGVSSDRRSMAGSKHCEYQVSHLAIELNIWTRS